MIYARNPARQPAAARRVERGVVRDGGILGPQQRQRAGVIFLWLLDPDLIAELDAELLRGPRRSSGSIAGCGNSISILSMIGVESCMPTSCGVTTSGTIGSLAYVA